MYCGYLSLRHNRNKNSRNLSLMITGTSTTLSRTSTPRKVLLLSLFFSYSSSVWGPLPPCARFGGSERHVSLNSTVEFLHVRLVLRLFSLPPPLLLLLLLLLQLQNSRAGGKRRWWRQLRHRQPATPPPGEVLLPRSAARCGHSAAARGQGDCPAAPPGVEDSMPVGRRAARAPLPPRPWPSSVPLERCGA